MEIGFLGAWGIAVLIASMSGAQAVKIRLQAKGVTNDYLFMALPVIISALGSSALAIGEQIPWNMVPLFVFVIGLGGNFFYKMWKGRAGVL